MFAYKDKEKNGNTKIRYLIRTEKMFKGA